MEVNHGGVGLASKQIAIALNFCGVAEFATTFINSGRPSALLDSFSTQKCLIKRCEADLLTPSLDR